MYPFIHIFGLKIPSYGLMMALAFAAAILLSCYRVKKAGLSVDKILDIALTVLICGMAGAYLLYIFVTYSFEEIFECIKDGSFRVFKDGGLVFYGGLIAGVLSGFLFCRIKKIDFNEYAAVIVPSLPLAHAIGRVGCFLAGCCYGRVCDTAISVIYKNPIGGAPVGVPVFPIQLVESGFNIIIFAVLLIYTAKRMKSISGLFLYLGLYAIERFVLEYFRADEIRGIFLGLSTSQWISVLLFAASVTAFIIIHIKDRRSENQSDVIEDEGSVLEEKTAEQEK